MTETGLLQHFAMAPFVCLAMPGRIYIGIFVQICRWFCFLLSKILFYIKKLEENVRKVFANFRYAWYTVWAIGKESKYVK